MLQRAQALLGIRMEPRGQGSWGASMKFLLLIFILLLILFIIVIFLPLLLCFLARRPALAPRPSLRVTCRKQESRPWGSNFGGVTLSIGRFNALFAQVLRSEN